MKSSIQIFLFNVEKNQTYPACLDSFCCCHYNMLCIDSCGDKGSLLLSWTSSPWWPSPGSKVCPQSRNILYSLGPNLERGAGPVRTGLSTSANPASISLTGVVETHLQGHSRSLQAATSDSTFKLYIICPFIFLTFWIFRHLVLYIIYFEVGVKEQQLAESSEHRPQILYPTKKNCLRGITSFL